MHATSKQLCELLAFSYHLHLSLGAYNPVYMSVSLGRTLSEKSSKGNVCISEQGGNSEHLLNW